MAFVSVFNSLAASTGVRYLGLFLALLMTGCAQIPRQPLVAQPMTARQTVQTAPDAPINGAIYSHGYGTQALFEDRRPRRIGDILTVLVSESVNATKNSGSNASRTTSAASNLGVVPGVMRGLLGDLSLDASGKNSLSAKGGANAANTFNGVITVTVVEVLLNGNLSVSGEKQMLINQGTEFIRFSGVVNPRTVGSNNTVPSTLVADARIEYSSKGYIDEVQNMGWLQRFFLNVAPF
ncbi:Flagellar L-ring protein [Polaromonas vacuolata]|uniref:Flagellar L-ring protein n=1 Tax=Polaromonas vacuolata TaxID=37448 RepID=A0A6H2H5L4_9BURK|nr:Flagellar L-ring protein [Polaromonas vacuolata]